MNLIEAAKTGRPFRRKGDAAWVSDFAEKYHITKKDLLSNDWEVKNPDPVVFNGILKDLYQAPQPELVGHVVDVTFRIVGPDALGTFNKLRAMMWEKQVTNIAVMATSPGAKNA